MPALSGPLGVASAAGQEQQHTQLTQMAGGSDAAQALLLSRCRGGGGMGSNALPSTGCLSACQGATCSLGLPQLNKLAAELLCC